MSKAVREATKVVKFEQFQYEVRVIVSDDVEGSRIKRSSFLGAWTRDNDTKAIHAGSANESAVSYLFLPYNCPADVIAHEGYHAIWRMMRYIGANHENEVMAYCLGYLVKNIVNHNAAASFHRKAKQTKRKKEVTA